VPVGRFVRELKFTTYLVFLAVDVVQCSPDDASFFSFFLLFQMFKSVCLQSAHEWLMLCSRIASAEAGHVDNCGPGFQAKAFGTRDGTSEGRSFGRLSVAGTVTAIDVSRLCFVCEVPLLQAGSCQSVV